MSATLCAVPWVHLNFEPDGKVIPCCLTSTHEYYSGDLTTDTIEEIWNSPNQRAIRQQMLAGEKPEICSKCYEREAVTGESSRVYRNREFRHVIPIIPSITLEDGTCTDPHIRYWDFRFSNLCNYKCRSCGPRYSSSWVPDAKKMGYITEQDKVWNIESLNDASKLAWLEEGVKHVERIYFAGGEPLLMPEHWHILDLLVKHKRFNVDLRYNTNVSTLEYQGRSVLDIWRLWEPGKIEVWPSIDEIGERAELIRSGTRWPTVAANLRAITQLESVVMRPGMTIGAWNVLRIPEIIREMVKLGVVSSRHKYTNFFFNLIQSPKHYHVSVLSDGDRTKAILNIQNFITEWRTLYGSDLTERFVELRHHLSLPHDPKEARNFAWTTVKLDQIRGENTADVIPEVKWIIDTYGPN